MLKIVTVLLLASTLQVEGGVAKIDDRGLVEDIDSAKAALESLISTNMQMASIADQISEPDVEVLNTEIDVAVTSLTHSIADLFQLTRALRTVSAITWYHLDVLDLTVLSTDMTKIRSAERAIWNGVIALEDQIQSLAEQIQASIDLLTEGIEESQLIEINYYVNNIAAGNKGNIGQLVIGRFDVVDSTNKALNALQVIVNQIPAHKTPVT